MGRLVERGVAEAYETFFSRMARTYPTCWHICCQAEWEVRFEWSVRELRRQKLFHAENPALSHYKPEMPWDSVLRSAVKSLETIAFWETNLKEKARAYQLEGSTRGGSS